MADLSWSLEKIAATVGGAADGIAGTTVNRVEIDSRVDLEGALFVALAGERFDGHDFVPEAAKKGALAVLVERRLEGLSLPQIVVEDTLAALQQLGAARRREFRGPVIGITGSSGKTTTRRILATLLGQRLVTHQPVKNFNNHVGVPLTLLALEQQHEVAVLELGCSDFGEIAELTRICDPDLALITNVGPAHLERLGDLDGVARAKGELFAGMRPDAVALINLDDPRVARMEVRGESRVTFGTAGDAQVRLVQRRPNGSEGQTITLMIGDDRFEAELGLLGAHNATNALAATAAAAVIGLTRAELGRGLFKVTGEPGRLTRRHGRGGIAVIDDTYNANPASMRAALATLGEVAGSGRPVAVLGDMLELGESFEEAHLELGGQLAGAGVELLVCLGEGGAEIGRGAREAGYDEKRIRLVADHAEAARAVLDEARGGEVVLVKGSRGMQMERIVSALVEGEG